jgi:hypothetical protein
MAEVNGAKPKSATRSSYEMEVASHRCWRHIFDTWREPSSIINWLLTRIPDNVKWYGVPGQHDLPNHQLDRIHESPYQTLVEAGKLVNLEPDQPVEVSGHHNTLRLYGFPHGVDVKPLKRDHISMLVFEIAVVHRYIWRQGATYHDAPVDHHVSKLNAKGYDAVVIGDNHSPWQKGGYYNCGSLICRTIDEKDHKPSVGLLRSDGTIKRHYLDVSKDKWNEDHEVKSKSKEEVDVLGLVRELRAGKTAVDFAEAIIRWLRDNPVSEGVRREIMEAMEGSDPMGRKHSKGEK